MTREHTDDVRRTVTVVIENFSLLVQDTGPIVLVQGDQMAFFGEYDDDIDR